MVSGRMLWVPKNIIKELESIQNNFKLPKRALAFDVMAHYCKVGRNLDFITPSFGLPKKLRK